MFLRYYSTPATYRQPTRQRTTNTAEINKQLFDHFDPGQVVLIQVFTPFSRLLISTAFVVVNRVGCLGVTDVLYTYELVIFHANQTTKCLIAKAEPSAKVGRS